VCGIDYSTRQVVGVSPARSHCLAAAVAEDAKSDGTFPLVTNVLDLSPLELLRVYKRRPTIEKRFAQLKRDF